MRFLADMGVGRSVVRWLRDNGNDAVHLLDEGLEQRDDAAIFAKALREQRILLTFDLDFADIVAASGGQAVSVILFRLQRPPSPQVPARMAAVVGSIGRCAASDPCRRQEGVTTHRIRRIRVFRRHALGPGRGQGRAAGAGQELTVASTTRGEFTCAWEGWHG